MWIVFGFKELQKEHGKAPRYCLRCRKAMTHDLVSVQAWFTLFFIPVVPLAPRSFMARCGQCGHHLPEPSRPMPRWTLAPRQRGARFWGWFFTIAGGLWAALMLAGTIGALLSDDPHRKEPPIGVLIAAPVITVLPPLGLGLLCFRKAARLGRALEVPETAEEKAALRPPPADHLEAYTQRLEKQAQLAELNRQRVGFLVVGWLCICSCLLIWIGPFFLWKARRLGQEMRELEAAGATAG